jgi:tRNA-splicing ligase RtcB
MDMHLCNMKKIDENEALVPLSEYPRDYTVYGTEQMEDGAKKHMEVAMKLPITAAGALMPDAHQGYGLPIGGVLATRNAVIPYGVGVDIAGQKRPRTLPPRK